MASTRGAGTGSAPNDDSDLEDLIAKSSTPTSGKRSQAAVGATSSVNFSPLECCTGSFRLFCYSFPCLSKCIMILSVLGILGLLSNTVFNTTAPMGIMGADYSAINSAFDLSLAKVDHWCIKGDNDSCKCEDPLEPTARSEFKSWSAAHKANVADVNLYRALFGSEPTKIDVSTGKPRPQIDVAFVGESVVEAMDGRWLGKKVVRAINSNGGKEGPEEKQKPDLGKTFERLFRKDKGGPVEGVALGIAGDNTANVLWRLQNDEMPYDFNPKVWWLVLGMNDLTRMQCSEEIVVLGILRVVEEIRLKKPDAHIVINSLLPMIEFQSLEEPKMADVVDFRTGGDNMKKNIEIEKAVKEYVGNGPPPMKGTEKVGRPGGRNLRSEPKKLTKKQKQWMEDHATEGPALEKAMARVKKSLERTDKRIINKMFSDTEKYHPKKGVIPFLPIIKKSALPPVWPAVHLINDKLREFCSKHESITFFDATPIFASDEGRGRHHLHNDLISPRGHPSDLGFAVWEGQIIGRLRKLILEKEKENEAKRAALPPPKDDDFHDEDEMGIEHVSDGKIAQPPPLPMKQPPRSDPTPMEKEEGREHVSGGGKTAAPPPDPMKQPPRASPTEVEKEEDKDDDEEEEEEDDEEDDEDEEEDDKDEEEEAKDDKDEKDDKEKDDDSSNVDDQVDVVKKSVVVAKKDTKVTKTKGDDDKNYDDDDDVDEDEGDTKKRATGKDKEKNAAKNDEDNDDDEVDEKGESAVTAQKKTKVNDDDGGDDDDNLHKEEEKGEQSTRIDEDEEEESDEEEEDDSESTAKKAEDGDDDDD